MYAIKTKDNEYVSATSPNWLNLLNDVSKRSEYATKFPTKKAAEDFANKLCSDGYDFMGAEVYSYFKIVRVKK